MEQYEKYTDKELLHLWDITDEEEEREQLFKYLVNQRKLFPAYKGGAEGEFSDEVEREYGLYPSIDDPRFHEKLFQKLEFAENKQESIADLVAKGVNPCDTSAEFELSPVQRFVSRFLSAQCPYQSALLYHGVGVGKTCAAVSIAESYLRTFPKRKVIIVAPPNIQPNFRRTIFDIENVVISEDENVPNTLSGCTGNFYLLRTGTEFEKEKGVIQSRVRASIEARYEFMGYIQFQRYIEAIARRNPSNPAEELRSEFSGRLVIIDEAHNLRDVPGETEEDNVDSPGGDEEVGDAAAGKRLTPSLLRVIEAQQGMKLVLLTATPMYNDYKEIIFLLRLLLRNDKRAALKETDIFEANGDFKAGGREKLGMATAAYVSFMRGENPLSFPIRLNPNYESGKIPKLETWPLFAPNVTQIKDNEDDPLPLDPTAAGSAEKEKKYLHMDKLPLVPVAFEGDSMDTYLTIAEDAIGKGGISVSSIDTMVQSGNWLFPADEDVPNEARIRDIGFDNCFKETTLGTALQFVSRTGAPDWLRKENLGTASPKTKFILKNIQTAEGAIFVYSRFIKSGALPLVLALEANGYTPYGRDLGFLKDGNQYPELGLQCALCPKKQKEHKGASHTFTPAKYILLTGKASISPNNSAMVNAARSEKNRNGELVKVVVGSQVASEGIDLRFIREIYVFDSWFHLNKMEQVLGRGVRTCSHALLPAEKRNTTIYLLVNTLPEEEQRETADMYMYRRAMMKAKQVGRVTRVLKEYALDCNLNINAILLPEGSLDDQLHKDAQGDDHTVEIHDTEFTAICDWIEGCDYKCAIPVDIDMNKVDISTYDEYSAQWHEATLKKGIREIFESEKKPMITFENLQRTFSALPADALKSLMSQIVGNSSFRVRIGSQEGYLVFRNGYYLFQPDKIPLQNIPLALRVQDFPIKRDIFTPPMKEIKREEVIATDIWNAFASWAALISSGTAPMDIPPEIKTSLEKRYKSKTEFEQELQHFYGIPWIYEFVKGNDAWRKGLAEVLLQVVWDELLTTKEQREYVKTDLGKRVGSEQYMAKGTREVFRYIDAKTGELKYMCGDAACDIPVAKFFDNDTSDPLNKIAANVKTMGNLYGFLIPNIKIGYLTFKTTDKPSPEGRAPPKGGACDIITQISFHLTNLVSLGDILAANGLPRMGFTLEEFKGPRKFQNSVRACSIKNIILRWMDFMKVGGRRWFLRPVAAYKSNHRELLEKPKKSRAKKPKAAAAVETPA